MPVRPYALMRDSEASRHACRWLSERGRTLSCLIVDGLAAVYAQEPALPPRSVEGAWEHAQVVAELHSIATVLPLRYGTVLPDAAEFERVLSLRHGEFLAALGTVDGCHEFGVRLLPAQGGGSDEPAAGLRGASGTAYLRQRRDLIAAEMRQRAVLGAAAEQVQESLKSLAVQSRSEESRTREGYHLSLDFLVRRELAKPFQRAVTDLPELPCIRLQCSGPWSPYQFARAILG